MKFPRQRRHRRDLMKHLGWSAILASALAWFLVPAAFSSAAWAVPVCAAAVGTVFGASWMKRRLEHARDRQLRAIRNDPDNRCDRCGADLWGFDVVKEKGQFRIKCGECGAKTVVRSRG